MASDEKKKAVKDVIIDRVIYCGPNLPGGALHKYSVFKGGIPEHLKNIIEENPMIKILFVNPSKLTETECAIRQTGTPENIAFNKIAKGEVI